MTLMDGKKQYTMFDLSAPSSDIWYWDNVISCPNELIDFIEQIDLIEDSYPRINKWQEWTASNDQNVLYGYYKTIIPESNNIQIENKRIEQKTRYIRNSISMALEMCFDRYRQGHALDPNKYVLDQNIINIKKWNVGQNMGPHADGQDGSYGLAFTMVLYLNDDYEGGEINFPNHNVMIKPRAGSLVMFPATSEFVHEVKPIVSGVRYTVPCSVLVV
jgi:hypothetical protein